MKIGFDNDKYIRIQSEHIKERIQTFGNKLCEPCVAGIHARQQTANVA